MTESGRFSRLLTERKHFIDTIKLIAYREEDIRALLRQIYETEIDLVPDLQTNTLTVRLHHLTQAARDAAVRDLCDDLNATETLFPGTDLKLVYHFGIITDSPRSGSSEVRWSYRFHRCQRDDFPIDRCEWGRN